MKHFRKPHFVGVGGGASGSLSGEPAHAAGNSLTFSAGTAPNTHLIRWIIILGIALVVVIIAATGLMLQNLRDRELAASEHELKRLTFILAEQIDRSFQSMELIQTAVIERMQKLGIASAEDYERQMSGQDTYQHLKDQISGLPYVDALVLFDTEGKRVNVSRTWPTSYFKNPDFDFVLAFKSDPHLTDHVSKPIRNPITGTWVVYIARRFTSPKGEYLGAVLGVVAMQSFERSFEAIAQTPNSTIALTRRDGMLLARWPHLEERLGRPLPDPELFANLLSQSDHASVRRIGVFDGKDRLVAAHSLAHYPIVVLATTAVADVIEDWRNEVIYIASSGILLAFLVGGLVFLSARHVGRRLRSQNLLFDAALNNMVQGLVMFNSSARVVVCNQRYMQMYKLSPEVVKPGCTLHRLLEHRKEVGLFIGDPDNGVAQFSTRLHGGRQQPWFRKLVMVVRSKL